MQRVIGWLLYGMELDEKRRHNLRSNSGREQIIELVIKMQQLITPVIEWTLRCRLKSLEVYEYLLSAIRRSSGARRAAYLHSLAALPLGAEMGGRVEPYRYDSDEAVCFAALMVQIASTPDDWQPLLCTYARPMSRAELIMLMNLLRCRSLLAAFLSTEWPRGYIHELQCMANLVIREEEDSELLCVGGEIN